MRTYLLLQNRMVFGIGETGSIQWIRWLVIVLAIVIIVVAILMVAGVNIMEFTPTTLAKETLFWKRYDPSVPLRVTYEESKLLKVFDGYTVMVDMLWVNTRVKLESDLYRHIVHRGSGEVANFLQELRPSLQNVSTEGATSTVTTLTRKKALGRMPQGLPSRMNPGILADPVTNDMLIFVDTIGDNKNYRESVRIPDIPMDQPFRLALVVMPNLVEVYINCRLEVTKLLEGRPRSMESEWYGLTGPEPLNAAVMNLRVFNATLGPQQLAPYCLLPYTFPDTAYTACNQAAA